MHTWKPCKLDELGFVGRGKSRHRPRDAAFLYGGPYPFFQTGDIKAANFHLTKYSQTYSEEGLAQSKLWKPGTLCITIAANIAESAILGVEGCFPDSVVGFIADSDKADVRFIKYYMEILKLQMQSVSRGTTQDNLSLDKLLTFDFRIPPLPVQRRIADILSAYDDLIENNTRRIKILEEMAQAIYREWFVNFRFPGHERLRATGSAALPQGWRSEKAKEIILRLKAGRVYAASEVAETGTVPVIDQSRDEILGFHENAPDHVAQGGKALIIFGDHTCKMQMMVEPFSIGPNVVPFASRDDIPIPYLFFLVRNLVETTEYKRHWNELMNKQVTIATPDLSQRFARCTSPFFEQTDLLRRRNANLRRTRDLLLPKLISGEIEC